MYALDTNILVYAHNKDSVFNEKASAFVEKVMNDRDENGNLSICIPSQVIAEFINVITRQSLTQPITLQEAISIIQDYLKTGVKVLHQKNSQIATLLDLLGKTQTRKKIFDVVLAATLKDNNIRGLYTVNIKDFEEFDFIDVQNPLKEDRQSASDDNSVS